MINVSHLSSSAVNCTGTRLTSVVSIICSQEEVRGRGSMPLPHWWCYLFGSLVKSLQAVELICGLTQLADAVANAQDAPLKVLLGETINDSRSSDALLEACADQAIFFNRVGALVVGLAGLGLLAQEAHGFLLCV